MDKIREHFQQTAGGSDNKYWKLKPGDRGKNSKAIIRVLPPWNKKGFFYHTGALHYGFSSGGRGRAISCPEASEIPRGKCLVCEFIASMKESGEDYEKLINRLRANRTYWVNIIVRGEEDEGIRIFGSNKKFIETILDADENPDLGDVTHPTRGRDIVMIRKGSGMATRYSYTVRTKRSPVEFDEEKLYHLDKDIQEWFAPEQVAKLLKDNFGEEIRDLGLKFKTKSKAEVENGEVEESEDEEEEEKPKKKVKLKVVKGKKKKRVVEEEDEDEVEDENESEEAEDEDTEEDDTDEEDNEDDEDDEE